MNASQIERGTRIFTRNIQFINNLQRKNIKIDYNKYIYNIIKKPIIPNIYIKNKDYKN